jgi:ATP-binding cassette subfamily C protein CydD
MNIDKNLLKLTSDKKKDFVASILSGVTASIFTILIAYLLSKSINQIFLEKKTLPDIYLLIFFFVIAAVLKAFFVWFEKNKISVVVSDVKKKLRKEINTKLFDEQTGMLLNKKSGELSNTVIKGVETLDAYFSEYLPQLFLSALTPLLILFFVLPLDVLSGIIFIITAPVIPLLMFLIGTKAEALNKKQWKSLNRMSGHFLDVLQGITTLKIFNRAKDEIKRIQEISDAFKSATMKVLKIAFLSALVLELLSTISIAIIAVEIGLRLLYGKMEFQNALFILILAPEFYLPLRQLGSRYHAGLEGLAAFNSIQKLLAIKPKEKIIPLLTAPTFEDNINFTNVSFKYPNRNEPAVKNISFQIKHGETLAIVGESGSGKTTIMNLLMRFINPDEGKISVGETELTSIPEEVWYNSVSWMPQTPHIFHKTIYENIAMAKPNTTEAEVIEAAKKAMFHNTILKFKNGYNTMVGEHGATLSGGEIQRLALARAFLRDSEILLLDEPTSGIDSVYEKQLLDSVKELSQNKTVIIVAHRLNTIINAERIIVMDKGEIAGEGNHFELLKENKVYKTLYNTFKREM